MGKYATQNNSNIIALSFHVDYWNRLGWKDSFSTGGYSQRQRLYAQLFSNSSVYTPQVIINGNVEMLGSDENKIAEAVAKATEETPSVAIAIKSNEVAGNKIAIQYSAAGNTSNN